MSAKRRSNRYAADQVALTPELFSAIVNYPLGMPECPIVLTSLTAEDANATRIVRNARRVLDELACGAQRLTPKTDQLNRRFVRAMLEELEWREGFAEERADWGVIDEWQLWPLFALRSVLQIGGLARKLHGKLLITKRGDVLRDPCRAGELHHHLVETYFMRFNIAAPDTYREDSTMQDHIPAALFILGTSLRKPQPLEEFARRLPHDDRLWIPNPTLGEHGIDAEWQFHGALTRRVLQPLEDFGLLVSTEGARDPDEIIAYLDEDVVRRWQVTPLFDRFISLQTGDRQVGLGDVTPQIVVEGSRGRVRPPVRVADRPLSVKESIDAFLTDMATGDSASDETLRGYMGMLEIYATSPFMGVPVGEGTPVEGALGAIPRMMEVAARSDRSTDPRSAMHVMAVILAGYTGWCVEAGQARLELVEATMLALDRWLIEGV